MGWKVKDAQEQRFRFIEDYEREDVSLSALCQSHGISRPTAYKWIGRYEEEGLDGLQDRSRAPASSGAGDGGRSPGVDPGGKGEA